MAENNSDFVHSWSFPNCTQFPSGMDGELYHGTASGKSRKPEESYRAIYHQPLLRVYIDGKDELYGSILIHSHNT